MEIHSIAIQGTDGGIMGSMRFALWVSKARETVSEYVLQ